MNIDFKRYKRSELTQPQRDFLQKLVPFAREVQRQTYEKAIAAGLNCKLGLSTSIVMVECILKSNWGKHEIAKKENNLCLLEKGEFWRNKFAMFNRKAYRSYDSWLDFTLDLSDEITFTELATFKDTLEAYNLNKQLDVYPGLNTKIKGYNVIVEDFIEKYGLWEFDY